MTDEFLLKSNVAVYLSHVIMWMPLVVVAAVSPFKPVTQDLLDTCWWLALAHSCIYSYVYAATNFEFREAFLKLFFYCCCKSHVTFQRKGAGPRRMIGSDGRSLRVHIIPGLNFQSGAVGHHHSATNVHHHYHHHYSHGDSGGSGTRTGFRAGGFAGFSRGFHSARNDKMSSQL